MVGGDIFYRTVETKPFKFDHLATINTKENLLLNVSLLYVYATN